MKRNRETREAKRMSRRSKLDMANIASSSKSGSFDICNPATIVCRISHFQITSPATAVVSTIYSAQRTIIGICSRLRFALMAAHERRPTQRS
jgi:hypothetical protein